VIRPVATDQSDRLASPCEDGGVALAADLRQDQATALANDILGRDDDMRHVP